MMVSSGELQVDLDNSKISDSPRLLVDQLNLMAQQCVEGQSLLVEQLWAVVKARLDAQKAE